MLMIFYCLQKYPLLLQVTSFRLKDSLQLVPETCNIAYFYQIAALIFKFAHRQIFKLM